MLQTSFRQGDAEVLIASDGELYLPENFLIGGLPEDAIDDIIRRRNWTRPNLLGFSNHPVIRIGNDIVLVDAGSGTKFQPTAGKLPENLKALGIDTSEITKIVITHAHPDHLWGATTQEGDEVFPNATYYIGAAEWDFWKSPDAAADMPDPMFETFLIQTRKDLAAIEDRVVRVRGGEEIAKGVLALDSHGHTPGHLAVEVTGGDGLIIAGDAVVNELISFEYPDHNHAFDMIPERAAKSRRLLLERAATEKMKILGYHFAESGVGYVERDGAVYKFVPLDESAN